MPFLKVDNITHQFGGLRAVHDYELSIEPGQIRGLIGPNGAGKTTIFNLITGIYTPTHGHIYLDGERISGLPPHRIASRGIGRTFQNLLLWRHMNVLEHVKMARYSRIGYGLLDACLGTPRRHRKEREIEEKALALLEMLDIRHLADQAVPNLPYGAQRRVEMARALATEPRLLLLDEPTAGMNPGRAGADHGHHPAGAPGIQPGDLSHRAPDAVRHGVVRADPDAGFRRGDRRRHAGGDPEQPQGHRGLPGNHRNIATMLLSVENLRVSYDQIRALQGISFEIEEGEIVCIIGANGAGKSTTLLAISRMVPVEAGTRMTYMDKDLLQYSADRVVSRLAHLPRAGGTAPVRQPHGDGEPAVVLFRPRKDDGIKRDIDRVLSIFPRLAEREHQKAGTLSGGEQQMLAVGRAFMSGRKLMLLDEPSMGLAPLMMKTVFDALREINQEGTTILLVEQNAQLALQFAGRGYVLENGSLVLEGKSADLLDDPGVKQAYLGG